MLTVIYQFFFVFFREKRHLAVLLCMQIQHVVAAIILTFNSTDLVTILLFVGLLA